MQIGWASKWVVGSMVLAALAVSCGGSQESLPLSNLTTPSSTDRATSETSRGGSATTSAELANPTVAVSNRSLPPGSVLPSDGECADRVVATPEVRPGNRTYNETRGRQKNIQERWLDRVTGDYSGTTDEILQWAACKWGIDIDIVRAQAAKESYWHMTNLGDFSTDPSVCPPDHPLGVDGKRGQCPESVGIMQIRYQYSGPPAGRPTWPEAERSTAYNVDFTYAYWRSCFEGELTWLNSVDRGRDYVAGDAWGCVGAWFSGRWYTQPAIEYMTAVRDYAVARVWTTASFLNAR